MRTGRKQGTGLSRLAAALAAVLALAAIVPALGSSAPPDVSGSRDPFGVDRVPRSWVVTYQREDQVQPRNVVLGKVDSIRRDVRIEDQIRVDASVEAVTYQMPDGVSVDAVVEHYARELGTDVLYQCAGRGCGRSNDWANQVFGQALLYGPDRHQRYVAREWQGRLVSLYAIERGNQRVYAHLRYYEPEGGLGIRPNALLARRLAERGWAPVDDVVPDGEGGFGDDARGVLGLLARELTDFSGQELYLVCHLYGDEPVEALLTASRRCAESGVALIVAGADAEDGVEAPRLTPFGAGPLLPRVRVGASRLEVVLPAVAGGLRLD
ncbi:MAG: DUF4892 domain-containing protein [Pseudomonadales bacterium]